MTKVHPNIPAVDPPAPAACKDAAAEILTVWRKSLLFNCSGFTVFDAKGNLVFRVDNYSSASTPEVVLMDAAGKPLLTLRRKKLSLADSWLVFDGEEAANPRFTARRHGSLLRSETLARVSTCGAGESASCGSYEVQGSYCQRRCAVFDARRRPVAEIQSKESAGGVALGADVFRLVVQPGTDAAVAMAIVLLLEQMFGGGARGAMALIKR